MGQQQLLLLVLSTVIVGLATVAGIQAFSENQAQATQDALVQRATELGSDALAAHGKPSALGGVTLSNGNTGDIASAIGLSNATGIDADGAGDGASCDIKSGNGDHSFDNSPDIHIECTGGGAEIEVGVDPDASGNKIETGIVSSASV